MVQVGGGVALLTVTLKLSECVVPCCTTLRVQFVVPAFIGVSLNEPIVAYCLSIEKREEEQTSDSVVYTEVHHEPKVKDPALVLKSEPLRYRKPVLTRKCFLHLLLLEINTVVLLSPLQQRRVRVS